MGGSMFTTRGVWGLAAAVAGGALLSACSLPKSIEEQADAIPPIKVMKTHYPAEYQMLIARLKAKSGESTSQVDIANAARPVFATLVKKQMPLADDQVTYQLLGLIRDETKTLKAASGRQCFEFTTGDGTANFDLQKTLTADEIKRDYDISAQLLEQTATRPGLPPGPPDLAIMKPLSLRALARLPQAEQDSMRSVSQSGRKPVTDDEMLAGCDFEIAMEEELLALPPAQAGPQFRSVIASN